MNKRTEIRSDLGKAIRELREARGLTLDALAAKAGMHTTYLSRIERAHSSPTWEKISALAEALDLPVSAIATAAEAQAAKRKRAR
ncbi:MAG: helix-turn-helix transcriptional regulator [Solirubrobacterales bacterium]|nr:helix-turn-helix transcriptional regulator [Solirubrobacterales bacterium]